MMNLLKKKFKAFYRGKMVYDAARVGAALYTDSGICINETAFEQEPPAVLLQFIGYTDANDVGIYEGDILRDEFARVLLVEWWNGDFTFGAMTGTNFKRTSSIREWFDGMSPRPILIGNAFENPELLGGDA